MPKKGHSRGTSESALSQLQTGEPQSALHAAPKADYPIATPIDLTNFDGFLFGIPTRYGRAVGAVLALCAKS